MILDQQWAKDNRPTTTRKVLPTISVGKSNVRINAALVRLMGIGTGMTVLLAQDIKYPKDFYLMYHPNGFPCTINKKTGEGSFSQSLYLALFQSALEQPNTDRFKFKVADTFDVVDGLSCYAINTVHPLLPAADSVADQSSSAAESNS